MARQPKPPPSGCTSQRPIRILRVALPAGSGRHTPPRCRVQALEELLEVLGAILVALIALLGVAVGTVFAANVGETRDREFDLMESFLVVS